LFAIQTLSWRLIVSEKKIIAVVGATGHQGGGLVRAILGDPDGPFAARVLTRHPESAKVKEFAERGAQVAEADLDDEASLRAGFDGAYGAFVVTNYWAPRTAAEQAERSAAQLELDQAGNAARAAKAARLRHVVWSTLEDTRPHFEHLGVDVPELEGDYKVPHFDAKAEANVHFSALALPTTFLDTSFYYEQLLWPSGSWRLRRDADDRLIIIMPIESSVAALVGAEDIGRTAYGIFRAGGLRGSRRRSGGRPRHRWRDGRHAQPCSRGNCRVPAADR
jgi:uncharacterized protein YbjT (DUF2867 family)